MYQLYVLVSELKNIKNIENKSLSHTLIANIAITDKGMVTVN